MLHKEVVFTMSLRSYLRYVNHLLYLSCQTSQAMGIHSQSNKWNYKFPRHNKSDKQELQKEHRGGLLGSIFLWNFLKVLQRIFPQTHLFKFLQEVFAKTIPLFKSLTKSISTKHLFNFFKKFLQKQFLFFLYARTFFRCYPNSYSL